MIFQFESPVVSKELLRDQPIKQHQSNHGNPEKSSFKRREILKEVAFLKWVKK